MDKSRGFGFGYEMAQRHRVSQRSAIVLWGTIKTGLGVKIGEKVGLVADQSSMRRIKNRIAIRRHDTRHRQAKLFDIQLGVLHEDRLARSSTESDWTAINEQHRQSAIEADFAHGAAVINRHLTVGQFQMWIAITQRVADRGFVGAIGIDEECRMVVGNVIDAPATGYDGDCKDGGGQEVGGFWAHFAKDGWPESSVNGEENRTYRSYGTYSFLL